MCRFRGRMMLWSILDSSIGKGSMKHFETSLYYSLDRRVYHIIVSSARPQIFDIPINAQYGVMSLRRMHKHFVVRGSSYPFMSCVKERLKMWKILPKRRTGWCPMSQILQEHNVWDWSEGIELRERLASTMTTCKCSTCITCVLRAMQFFVGGSGYPALKCPRQSATMRLQKLLKGQVASWM